MMLMMSAALAAIAPVANADRDKYHMVPANYVGKHVRIVRVVMPRIGITTFSRPVYVPPHLRPQFRRLVDAGLIKFDIRR
jgi:hypothetical protein